ncbi:unnamed protein product [Diamesa tonsa]
MAEMLDVESKMDVCVAEKVNMESLPPEVLIKIFSFCDEAATENLTVINKKWLSLIVNNRSTMMNMPLRIHNNWSYTFKVGGHFNRNYHYVSVQSLSKPVTPAMLKTWERVGTHVKQLECIQSRLHEPEVIVSVLNSFPNVEKVSFKSSQLEPYDNIKISTRVENDLNQLKTLVMYNNCELVNFHVFTQLARVKLNTLKINSLSRMEEDHNLMRFLCTQDKMENLALRGIFASNNVFSPMEDCKITFKLKSLSLREFSSGPKYGNVLKFLQQQRDNLVHFELGNYFTSDIYEFVFNRLLHLNTLFLDVSGVPPQLDFYDFIRINHNPMKLRLRGEIKNNELSAKILSLFPNVYDLRISSKVSLETLEYMRANLTHLTRISLHILPSGVPKNITFPNLKVVHLDWLDHTIDWVHFLASNTTIEELSLKWSKNQFDTFGAALKTVCQNLPMLRILKIGTLMNIDMEKIRDIQSVCKGLDTIDILDENLDFNYMDDGMMLKKNGFKFCAFAKKSMKVVFPPEDSVWKDDDGDYDSDSGLCQPGATLERTKYSLWSLSNDDEEYGPIIRTWRRKHERYLSNDFNSST